MADYNKWTKEDLINRVKQLENELKTQEKGDVQPPESNTSVPGQPPPKKQKKAKTMDPSKYKTRFIALKLAYLGKNYNGFEYQASGLQSTIEEELWKALVKTCLIFPDPEKPNEINWNVCEYSKCGRTDRGVSAFGQVVALRVRSNKPARRKQGPPSAAGAAVEGAAGPEGATRVGETDVVMSDGAEKAVPEKEEQQEEEEEEEDDTPLPIEQEIQYVRVLNRILPPDIRIYAWLPNPPPDFSARFSCLERQYRYFFTQPAFAPLPDFLEHSSSSNNRSGGLRRPKDGWLDIDAMRRAAKMFEGLHDFRNFCKIDPTKQITNFVRRIYESDIEEVDGVDSALPYLSGAQFFDPSATAAVADAASSTAPSGQQRYPKVYCFHVRGSAFLWHQIRCMVAVLFLVGQGLEPASVVADLLDGEKHPRRPNYVLADDAPLVLWDCVFGARRPAGQAHAVSDNNNNNIGNNDEGDDDAGAEAEAEAEAVVGVAEGIEELAWTYVGADGPLNLHGTSGLLDDLWAYWRERKIDEVLANRLLDLVSRRTGAYRGPTTATDGDSTAAVAAAPAAAAKINSKNLASTRVFEGGNRPKLAGSYVPVMKKEQMQSPEEQNDRWAQRKGFRNSEEMRARGNWREVIRAAKEAGVNTWEI